MSEDEKFASKDDLQEWLKGRGVDEDDVAEAADKLFANRFNKPSRLLGITVDELKNDAGIQNPLARELSNQLENKVSLFRLYLLLCLLCALGKFRSNLKPMPRRCRHWVLPPSDRRHHHRRSRTL